MDRYKLNDYIKDTYNTEFDTPWYRYPDYYVYRHKNSNKWFAVIMRITKDKLGINSKEIIDITNLKCDNNFIGSLICEKGIYPAYHMNKEHWISVALDGSVPNETIKLLLDISFNKTAKKNGLIKESVSNV